MFSSTFASFEEESSSFSSESNERFFEAIPPKGDAAVVADAEPKGFVPKGCALKAANGCCPIGNGSFDGVGNLMFDDVPKDASIVYLDRSQLWGDNKVCDMLLKITLSISLYQETLYLNELA